MSGTKKGQTDKKRERPLTAEELKKVSGGASVGGTTPLPAPLPGCFSQGCTDPPIIKKL